MSSHPTGIRFSPFSSSTQLNKKSIMQQQQQPQTQNKQQHVAKFNSINYSDSETDLSNSIENLSLEERFVLRHTARVEPQGQEHLPQNVQKNGRYIIDKNNRLSSNTSTDSTRYPSNNRSMSETRNSIYNSQQQQQILNVGTGTLTTGNNSNSNRNSLKEINSNRSSMDVSTCSYNTLIIHDDNIYTNNNRDFTSPPPYIKKERPRSYGEKYLKGMQEITEIPDDYLSQSHVLKHLAKEVKNPTNKCDSITRDSGVSEINNSDTIKAKHMQERYKHWTVTANDDSNQKLKSKSQPDLTRLGEIDLDSVEAIIKENAFLKKQLSNCLLKVAKTQKLEEEVAKIYHAHEELEQSCQRREKLELTIRNRFQNELQRAQELNRVLRDQIEVHQSQLIAPSEHQLLIAQLFTQNKELAAAKERQEIELAAQRATLQEQRNHIGILDSALTNTQNNMRRLEEELRKKQMYIERLVQLQQNSLQSKQLIEYDDEISKDSNRSGSSTNSESKWQLQEKDGQIISYRLDNECTKLEQRHQDDALRQNAKIVMEKNSQETDRIIAEAKQEKLRYLEEVHAAQRKVGELQNHLKGLESRLAEKEALIRALQGQKNYGSSNSYDSYNLSTDSYTLNPLVYNSQASFNVSNSSFNTTANTSLLDPSFGQNSTNGFSPTTSFSGVYNVQNNVGINNDNNSYGTTQKLSNNNYNNNNQNSITLQNITMPSNFSTQKSAFNKAQYATNPNYTQTTASSAANYDNNNCYESHLQYDSARKSIDEHMKKQLDEQLLNKRGLCCFPGLSGKKQIQSLLSDEVSVLSTNNSDAFLQKLAHYDQIERERQEQMEQAQTTVTNQTKTEEIVLLEKQGRISQKIRNGMGNLALVSQNVGQNMTDISNIGNSSKVQKIVSQNLSNINQSRILPPRKDRGASLPPSALPRPPRSLKPLRKIEYDRLSDSEIKKRSLTPPISQRTLDLKKSEFGKREFSPNKNYLEMKESLEYSNKVKHKNYGTMTQTETKFTNEFLKPDFSSTKNYQRLDDTKSLKNSSSESLKRSLLPSARKINGATGIGINQMPVSTLNIKNSRDSLNSGSSCSNNSNNSNQNSRSSPIHHVKTDSNTSNLTYNHHPSSGNFNHSRTPPKYIRLTPSTEHRSYNLPKPTSSKTQQYTNNNQQTKGPSFPNATTSAYHSTLGSNIVNSSLPPKPLDNKNARRGSSLSRGENRYRIQF